MSKRLAFTLIELLVVIAIVAILASILFPVFAMAKQAAKKTGDTSNLKQLGVAFQLYMVDSDGTFPPLYYVGKAGQTVPDNFGLFRWPWLVQPYTKSFQIFWSPLDTDKPEWRSMSGGSGMNGYYFGLISSWGYNQESFSPMDLTSGLYVPISESVVSEPSNTLMLASSIYWTSSTDPKVGYYRLYPPNEWAGTTPLSGLSYGHVWPRLNGTQANVLHPDSHVRSTAMGAVNNAALWKAVK